MINNTQEYYTPTSKAIRKQEIVDRYIKGESSTKIAAAYNINYLTVLNYVKKANVSIRNPGEYFRKHTFKYDFFETIDEEAKAYFLGFLITDGTVVGKNVTISLHSKDRHIIETYAECLDCHKPIHDRFTTAGFSKSGTPVSLLALFSDKYSSDLKALGVIERKTYNTTIPKINENLERHLWRGILDGDGFIYVSKNKKVISAGICGHINTMNAFKEFLDRHKIPSGKITPESSVFSVRVTGKYCLQFLNLIYKDSDPELRLKRKFAKYQEYLEYKQINEKSKEMS